MNHEILDALSQITREKSVDRALLIETLEQGLASAVRKKYGATADVEVKFSNETGAITIALRKTVVETVEDPALQLTLEEARAYRPGAAVGDVITFPLPIAEFGRNAIQTAMQVLIQRVREAERERVYREYSDKIGALVRGVVQQVDRGNVIVKLDHSEGFLPARVMDVRVNEPERRMSVVVADDQLSLAIGKGGQNARLAARLTGWKIDLISKSEEKKRQELERASRIEVEQLKLGEATTEKLISAGIETVQDLIAMPLDKLVEIPGIGEKTAEKVLAAAHEYIAEHPPVSAEPPVPELEFTPEMEPAPESAPPGGDGAGTPAPIEAGTEGDPRG
jgi:hypothetical protein